MKLKLVKQDCILALNTTLRICLHYLLSGVSHYFWPLLACHETRPLWRILPLKSWQRKLTSRGSTPAGSALCRVLRWPPRGQTPGRWQETRGPSADREGAATRPHGRKRLPARRLQRAALQQLRGKKSGKSEPAVAVHRQQVLPIYGNESAQNHEIPKSINWREYNKRLETS